MQKFCAYASLNLASKSAFSFSVEDLKTQNKTSKQNVQSALTFHYTSALANKKQLINNMYK